MVAEIAAITVAAYGDGGCYPFELHDDEGAFRVARTKDHVRSLERPMSFVAEMSVDIRYDADDHERSFSVPDPKSAIVARRTILSQVP